MYQGVARRTIIGTTVLTFGLAGLAAVPQHASAQAKIDVGFSVRYDLMLDPGDDDSGDQAFETVRSWDREVLSATPAATVTAKGDPPPTVKAPLPKSAYKGLACDPFDSKLTKVALNNGVGPEARVTSACMQLAWRARGKVKTPEITVYSSPGFPAKLTKRIKGGIKAGHRLFGEYADVRTYEALASVDPAFSCSTGKAKVDPRTGFDPTWLQSWQATWNSGCPGTDYSPGGWTSTILGEGGREYFGWTLIKPEQSQMLTDTNVLGPTWFLGAVSHEYAHSIQSQRSVETTNGSESMGRWFGEGQAQYLGDTVAGLTIGPKDIRSHQLDQLRQVMREEGISRINLESMELDWGTNLVYPAGYFAYEWLVAHYGVEATFTWWDEWNSDCPEPGKGICWRERAEELYGMSADELIDTLNDYVNAQVKG